MELLMVVASGLAAVVLVSLVLMKWNDIKFGRNGLPPGTMGWPLFGETTEFLKLGPRFMKERRSRYGSVFRSHILACPTIVSMDPELNRYILLNESKGLVPGYPQSMLDLVGRRNIAAVHGSEHKRIRGSMMALISPAVIREQQVLLKIDEFMRAHLAGWDGKIIDIQEKSNEMALYVAFRQMVEGESSTLFNAFKREFDKLFVGTLSLPIKIPGTNYHQGFQGRKNIVKLLSQLMETRRADSSMMYNDMLSFLMEDTKYPLTDEEIVDQVVTMLYSGYETVSTTSMMAVKYLTDNPQFLQQLRDEHLAIRSRKGLMDPVDWDDYKSMSFTRAVIFETMRLATVVNGVMRRTTEEIELNGFVIPKGWRIYVYTREINYDPFLYPEPLAFNPRRWLVKELEHHKYCLLFGGGGRLCPGKELGIVKISFFLHYFVTKYRWEEVGGEEIVEFPRVEAPNGLHLKVSNYSS
uniref:Cytochrome P450 n=1 Tax=Kalanchoe fedtschenkoi TaxID=63787 RepID=A0A7N0ZRE0_KALFE